MLSFGSKLGVLICYIEILSMSIYIVIAYWFVYGRVQGNIWIHIKHTLWVYFGTIIWSFTWMISEYVDSKYSLFFTAVQISLIAVYLIWLIRGDVVSSGNAYIEED